MIQLDTLNRLCEGAPFAWAGVIMAGAQPIFSAIDFDGDEPCSFAAIVSVADADRDASAEIARLIADATEYFGARRY